MTAVEQQQPTVRVIAGSDAAPVWVLPGIFVRYPYQRAPDWYLCLKGAPMFCCRCEATMPQTAEALVEHLRRHDRRRRHAPIHIVIPAERLP